MHNPWLGGRPNRAPPRCRRTFSNLGRFRDCRPGGYETLIRIGYAIDGPRILARKIWPTLFAATVGAAAVASRACGLNGSQTVGALATAFAASTGIAPPALTSNSSRCISLGFAAEHGVRAAMAARAGALGDVQLIERHAGRIAGMRISRRRLLQGAGLQFFFDEIELKPYPIARQGLAAVEACRQLAGRNTKGITAITVSVPSAQARVIDHPSWPANRMQSIASIQYQIALALLAPDRLMNFARTPPFVTPTLRSLAAKVRVRTDARLETRYPDTCPAHVVWSDPAGAKRRLSVFHGGTPGIRSSGRMYSPRPRVTERRSPGSVRPVRKTRFRNFLTLCHRRGRDACGGSPPLMA